MRFGAEKNPLNLIRVMPAKGQDTMQAPSIIARLLGPLLAAVGIGMLTNTETDRVIGGFITFKGYGA
jgi:hypothetical protein